MIAQVRIDESLRSDQCLPQRGRLKLYLCLFLVSLTVRSALWIAVSASGMTTMYDEGTYLTRAVGYGNIVKTLLSGNQPDPTDYDWAYSNGGWPPLHPFLIGLAFAAFGPSIALARLVIVLQSALTTCVVYALTRRVSEPRAALFAAVLHIFYPSFLAYSHLLWSETTYVLMCLSALYFSVRAIASEENGRWQFIFILFSGLSLGLAGLTRAAVLPLLLVIPSWQMWKIQSGWRRILLPLATLLVALATITPWQVTLCNREGRFVPLSTAAGYNLYLGNNPWTGQDQVRHEARAQLQTYMDRHKVSRDEAGRALALGYIRSDPLGFAARCWRHARALYVPDWYVLRHLLYATYPPIPDGLALVVIVWLFGALAILLGCATYGFSRGTPGFTQRGLLAACIIFGMLPSLPTIANSRMVFPLLALLVPAGGIGLAAIIAKRRRLVGLFLLTIAGVTIRIANPSLPDGAFGTRNQVSTHYASAAAMLERFFGARLIAGKDRIMLRYVGPDVPVSVTLSITDGKHVFQDSNSSQTVWQPGHRSAVIGYDIVTADATAGPPQIELSSSETSFPIRFAPVDPAAWRCWQSTGVAHFEFLWLGAAGITDERVALLLQK